MLRHDRSRLARRFLVCGAVYARCDSGLEHVPRAALVMGAWEGGSTSTHRSGGKRERAGSFFGG